MYKILEIKPRLTPLLFFVLIIDFSLWYSANYVAGILFAVLAFGITFMTSGFLIDKENNKIKRIRYFLGISFGRWSKLPEIKYISIVRTKQSRKSFQASSDMFVQTSSKNFTYRINLVYKDSKRDRAFRLIAIKDREKAIKKGLNLGDYFDTKVLDFSTPIQKWIKE